MANDTIQASRDWLANTRTSALAWWIPQVAIVGGLFVPVPIRAAIWIIALIWMDTACILNARRCNRTHCRAVCARARWGACPCGGGVGISRGSGETVSVTIRPPILTPAQKVSHI
jgi:hypothetical protein